MTGQELMTELGNKGITLFLSGGRIGYRYIDEGAPDREQVIPILEELRRKREEVRELLSSRTPDLGQYPELFRLALAEVAARDPQSGAIRQIRQNSPEAWAGIQAFEDEVNELWKQAQAGYMVWELYQSAVRKWKEKFIQALEAQKGGR